MLKSAEPERDVAADAPQHADEGQDGEDGAKDADREIDRRVGGDARVLADPVLGIGMVAGNQVELVIAALVHPALEQVIVQPGAPAPLRAHAGIDREHGEADPADRQRHEDHGLGQDHAGILLLDGVEDVAVPDIDPVLDQELDQHECQQADGHQPGDFPGLAAPESACRAPEQAEQGAPCLFVE